jgi:hypothetical protein
MSQFLNLLLEGLTGSSLSQHYNTPDPLWQALGSGSQHHGSFAEGLGRSGWGGAVPLAGLGLEAWEALIGGDPQHFQQADTFKDVFANLIGAISGSPLPEGLKANILNSYVPYTLGLPSGPGIAPTSAQQKFLPSKGDK